MRTLLIGAALILLCAPSARSAVEIRRVVLASGGGVATSPTHLVRTTIGQGVVGAAAAATHTINAGFWAGPIGVVPVDEATPPVIPSAYSLEQNSPNPFNPLTTIRYDVPREGNIRLTVFTIDGRPIATLVDAPQAPGRYEAIWDGRNDGGLPVASGMYLYALEAPGYRQTRKMVLLK